MPGNLAHKAVHAPFATWQPPEPPQAQPAARREPQPIFKTTAGAMLDALKPISKAVTKRPPLPILGMVRIEVEAGLSPGIHIAASNLETTSQRTIRYARCNAPGAICVNPRDLMAILKTYGSGEVIFGAVDNDTHTLTLQGGVSKTRFRGLPANEYPPVAKLPRDPQCQLPATALYHMLSIALPFASHIAIDAGPDGMEVAGWNRHAMAQTIYTYDCLAPDDWNAQTATPARADVERRARSIQPPAQDLPAACITKDAARILLAAIRDCMGADTLIGLSIDDKSVELALPRGATITTQTESLDTTPFVNSRAAAQIMDASYRQLETLPSNLANYLRTFKRADEVRLTAADNDKWCEFKVSVEASGNPVERVIGAKMQDGGGYDLYVDRGDLAASIAPYKTTGAMTRRLLAKRIAIAYSDMIRVTPIAPGEEHYGDLPGAAITGAGDVLWPAVYLQVEPVKTRAARIKEEQRERRRRARNEKKRAQLVDREERLHWYLVRAQPWKHNDRHREALQIARQHLDERAAERAAAATAVTAAEDAIMQKALGSLPAEIAAAKEELAAIRQEIANRDPIPA